MAIMLKIFFINSNERDILSIICSSFLFGTIFCPFLYIAFGVLSEFPNKFIIITIPILILSTGFLFLTFTVESKIECYLKQKSGIFFRPFFVVTILLLFFVNLKILSIIANFTLLTDLEYWFYLSIFWGISWTISFFVLFLMRPLRLEVFICMYLTRSNNYYLHYRKILNIILLLILMFVFWIFYKFYLFVQRPVY